MTNPRATVIAIFLLSFHSTLFSVDSCVSGVDVARQIAIGSNAHRGARLLEKHGLQCVQGMSYFWKGKEKPLEYYACMPKSIDISENGGQYSGVIRAVNISYRNDIVVELNVPNSLCQ
jgi:hypothetical protein